MFAIPTSLKKKFPESILPLRIYSSLNIINARIKVNGFIKTGNKKTITKKLDIKARPEKTLSFKSLNNFYTY